MSETQELTPVKIKCSYCLVCKKEKHDLRHVNSEAGTQKNLRELLKKYGELDVIEGSICRACEKKLFNLHEKCTSFRDQCLSACYTANVKRCLTNSALLSSQSEKHLSAFQKQVVEANRNQDLVDEKSLPVSTIQSKNDDPKTSNSDTVAQCIIKRLTVHDYCLTNSDSAKIVASNSDTVAQCIIKSLTVHDYCLTNSDSAKIVRATNTKVLNYVVDTINTMNCGKEAIQQKTVALNDKNMDTLRKMKHSPSVLLHTHGKSLYETLVNFSWESCVTEFYNTFPTVCSLIVGMMLSAEERCTETDVKSIYPKLGLIYGIIVQCRIPYLSRVQRMMSATLMDSLLDVKGFDRLEPTGVCISYARAQLLLDAIRGDFDAKVIDAVKNGKKIRLVGDKVNLTVGCRDERSDRHGKMLHYFCSAVIVHNLNFPEANSGKSQMDHHNLKTSDLLPNISDVTNLVDDYAHMVMHVAIKHIAYFKFLKELIPSHKTDEISEQLNTKTVVIPLQVLAKNEQKYGDAVDILRHYETTMSNIYDKAGVPFADQKIHIGGDQSTRENFSEAKRLMIGSENAADHFEHLTPITAEFFHMAMKLLSVVFKRLFNANSVHEIGTMKAMQPRLQRTAVDPNESEAYSVDKDFFISLTDAHIVEAVLHYFEMEDTLSSPAKEEVPDDTADRLEWAKKHFRQIIERTVGTFRRKMGVDRIISDKIISTAQEVETETEPDLPMRTMTVKLPNSQEIMIDLHPLKQAKKHSPSTSECTDKVQAYALLLLELGLLFKNLTESIEVPNRSRMLRTLKLMMIIFKADNDMSKYADEILRFLVHQTCTLSEHDAKLTFYSMFINTEGRIDSHIAADMQMEFIARTYKKHIKHMLSNKTEFNIERKTSALGSLFNITTRYDYITSVVARTKSHSKPSEMRDEISMLEDLRKLNPFKQIDSRSHESFKNIQPSLLAGLDDNNFFQWLMHRAKFHATSL